MYKNISLKSQLSGVCGETRTANQRRLEILNFAWYLISELSLVRNWQVEKKKEIELIKKERVHIGYSD